MRQLIYVSVSRVGTDVRALDRLMVEARVNNSLDGITGLLWTDGKRFAQVIEGDDAAVARLLQKLRLDIRHSSVEVVGDLSRNNREFGDWSMGRPADDRLFASFQDHMRARLARLNTDLSVVFMDVMSGSAAPSSR